MGADGGEICKMLGARTECSDSPIRLAIARRASKLTCGACVSVRMMAWMGRILSLIAAESSAKIGGGHGLLHR